MLSVGDCSRASSSCLFISRPSVGRPTFFAKGDETHMSLARGGFGGFGAVQIRSANGFGTAL